MNSKLSILLLAASVIIGGAAIAETKKDSAERSMSLRDAVKELNARAKKDEIGKTQQPLTADEVIAAIRMWDRESMKVDDRTYAMFQEIAKSQKVPAGTKFDFMTRCSQCNGYDVDVWWVDLVDGDSRYRYRIRDRKLKCVTDPNGDRFEINEVK